MSDSNVWQYDEKVRSALEEYIAAQELTHGEMGEKLRLSPTRVTKYLGLGRSGKAPEADMKAVETAVKNFLRHMRRQEEATKLLFENSVSKQVASVFRQIRATGDIGLIRGPAGMGKSSGAELFRATNEDTLMLTARKYCRRSSQIEQTLFQQVAAWTDKQWKSGIGRTLWMENVLRGSECLIIVDNAHRLKLDAFETLFDLHDATGCPIGLVGNPEALETLKQSDQLFSRVGLQHEVNFKKDDKTDDIEFSARKLIGQFAPESGDELVDEAAKVLNRSGHMRTLRKQLVLAKTIFSASRDKDWTKSFLGAGEKLIKNIARK